MRAGSLEVAVMDKVWDSLVGPAVVPVSVMLCAPASSLMVRFGIGLRVGGSLTGLTVRRKLWLAGAPFPSVTVKVMVVAPNWLVPGVIMAVRLAPLPPRIIFWLGTRLV